MSPLIKTTNPYSPAQWLKGWGLIALNDSLWLFTRDADYGNNEWKALITNWIVLNLPCHGEVCIFEFLCISICIFVIVIVVIGVIVFGVKTALVIVFLQLYTHVFLYLCIFYHGNNQSYCITSLRALFSASSALVTGNLWLLFWCSTAQPAYNIQAEWILCLRSSSVCVLQDFNRFEIRSGGILQKQTQVPQKQRCVPPIPPGQIHTQDVYGHWSFVAR